MRLSPHPISLRQLQYVVAVADRQSFRKAAEACRVAQPSLSAQLAQLEHVLSVRLFERDARGVRVTPAGERFVTQARALLVAADELVDAAEALSDPLAGELRLGVIPTIAPYLLPEATEALRRALPRARLRWQEEKTSSLLQRLAEGSLDGAILARTDETERWEETELGLDPFVLAARDDHPLVQGRGPLAPSALDGEAVLLLDDGHCFRDQALDFCRRAGAREGAFRSTSLPTLVQLAASGEGVTLLPRLSLAVENRLDTLRTRALGPNGPARTLVLAHRPASARREALALVSRSLRAALAAR